MANWADKMAALFAAGGRQSGRYDWVAHLMGKDGHRERVLSLCHKALALAPTDAKLVGHANGFVSRDLPAWHFSIACDDVDL